MNARPDAVAVHEFFARVARRLAWLATAQGATVGFGLAFVLTVAMSLTRGPVSLQQSLVLGAATVLIAAAASLVIRQSRNARIAAAVELREPRCRNLLITADELLDPPPSPRRIYSADNYVGDLVLREAARLTGSLDPRALFPARQILAALAAAAALWAFSVVRAGGLAGTASLPFGATSSGSMPAIDRVDVIVTPPTYSAKPVTREQNPSRITALVGSRIQLAVGARASSVVIETLRGRDTLSHAASGTFDGEFVADADGYVAIEPSANGKTGTRRLIGLSVIPDEAPRARITAPGKDLFLRDANETLDLAVQADDDIGLASLRLRYTKVSGSGERFTFTEGEVPLTITRTDAKTWAARARWPLGGLGLSAGDMVVYRAVVTDHRPGSTPSESDSFIAEILAPGGDAAPGFALDPDQERYAVSQQMVILKTERLAAKKPSMSAESYSTAAQEIAAEQRKVRAEFVFMMGGELADAPDPDANISDLNEETEAQGEEDLAAGRMVNQGRIALLRAIRSMSRAATSLTVAELPPALTHERAALAQLERAFSRSRILLRALTEREKLDLSRRLTGSLADAARDTRPSAQPVADTRLVALRRSLAGIAALVGRASFAPDAAATASSIGASVLRVDASDKSLQAVAAELSAAAASLERGRAGDARRDLEKSAESLATVLRRELLDAPPAAPPIGMNRLGGSLVDALQRRGVQR